MSCKFTPGTYSTCAFVVCLGDNPQTTGHARFSDFWPIVKGFLKIGKPSSPPFENTRNGHQNTTTTRNITPNDVDFDQIRLRCQAKFNVLASINSRIFLGNGAALIVLCYM